MSAAARNPSLARHLESPSGSADLEEYLHQIERAIEAQLGDDEGSRAV